MKRILSTALAITLFIGAAQAQTTEQNKERHRGMHGEMMKELNLSAEQQAKLKTIHEAEKKEMQALKTDADKAARKELHEKYKTQFESVLTAGQKTKLKEAKKEGKGERFGKDDRKEKGHASSKELNLSADQKAKVSSLNQEFKTKMDGVRNNSSLSQDEKKVQIKSLAEAHKTNLKTILTPEQAEKMKTLHKRKDRNDAI